LDSKAHDPYPDGKTGPFLRERHAHNAKGALVYDERCSLCHNEAVDKAVADAIEQYGEALDRLADL
jgi:cytochrome c5